MRSLAPNANISDLLKRVTRRMLTGSESQNEAVALEGSVWLTAAAQYASGIEDYSVTRDVPSADAAAALFEAIVESAFLVANADGVFDATERAVFTLVVSEASERRVTEQRIEAIVLDLTTQLEDDGIERRLEQLARAIRRPSDRREVLGIAALLAQSSAGVSADERAILERMATLWELGPAAVEEALVAVNAALGVAAAS